MPLTESLDEAFPVAAIEAEIKRLEAHVFMLHEAVKEIRSLRHDLRVEQRRRRMGDKT